MDNQFCTSQPRLGIAFASRTPKVGHTKAGQMSVWRECVLPQKPIMGKEKKTINIKNFGGTPPSVRPVCPGDTSHLPCDMSHVVLSQSDFGASLLLFREIAPDISKIAVSETPVQKKYFLENGCFASLCSKWEAREPWKP